MRRLFLSLVLFASFLAPSAWLLLSNPWAWPLLQRGAEGVAARIDLQMARAISEGQLNDRISEAVAIQDFLAAEALLEIARSRNSLPAEPLLSEAAKLAGEPDTGMDAVRSCAACAYDVRNCRALAEIAKCNIPVELTPLGDVNALRRQVANSVTGAEIDQLEAGLAVVGLAATAAVVVSGGSSATIKAGASAGRIARRMGAVSPGLSRTIGNAADLNIQWRLVDDYLFGTVAPDALADAAKIERLSGFASDFGRIVRNTSASDTLVLLRQIDNGEDLARMVRASSALGADTRGSFALLGKSRVFRALDEVGKLLRWVWAALVALCLELVALVLGWMLRRLRRSIGSQLRNAAA